MGPACASALASDPLAPPELSIWAPLNPKRCLFPSSLPASSTARDDVSPPVPCLPSWNRAGLGRALGTSEPREVGVGQGKSDPVLALPAPAFVSRSSNLRSQESRTPSPPLGPTTLEPGPGETSAQHPGTGNWVESRTGAKGKGQPPSFPIGTCISRGAEGGGTSSLPTHTTQSPQGPPT